jgi:hypothetical protein
MGGEIKDDDFVRFDPSQFDSAIEEFGIQRRFFEDGYIWLTKYGDMKRVEKAADLEQILYRRNLWDKIRGKFDNGATLRVVRNVVDAVAAGRTNMVKGVRQWRISRDVNPADLAIVMRIT